MKLVAENLGRIAHAEIELRPLTVFIGENGTNKTWTAHGLFVILERLRTHARGKARLDESDSSLAKVLDEQAASIVQRAQEAAGEAWFDLRRNDVLGALPSELSFSLAHPRWDSAIGFTPSEQARLTLSITRDEFSAGVASSLRIGLSLEPFRMTTELFVEGLPEPLRATDFGAPNATADAHAKIRGALEMLLFGWKRRVRVLPVEREHLAQVFPWLLSPDYRLPMPRALVDFCYLMNEARGRSDMERPANELRAAIHHVLGGQFRFVGSSRELMFEPAQAGVGPVPIRATASLGKSLVGLDIFLWSAGSGDVLLIDEPEMNAHPEAQVALVELFALMIRAGMHLVIVTHSPYILDHLSTIIEASRLDDEQRRRAALALVLKNPHAYVRPEDVAVWHFGKDGSVTSRYDPEARSIDWSTFTKVSDRESIALNRIIEEAVEGAPDGA